MKYMRIFLLLLVGAALSLSAAAQGVQGTASSDTSVSASRNGAQANSSTSSNVNASGHDGQASAGANSATNANISGQNSQQKNDKNDKKDKQSKSNSSSGSIASGTTMNAVLTKPVDARHAKPGDQVVAKTTSNTKAADGTTVPKGTKLIGHVTEARTYAKGHSDSALGIAFDQAEMKGGETVPFNASIQALAAAQTVAATDLGEDSGIGAAGGGGVRGGGGGVLGGTRGAVGGVTN